jgi:hypothetical protein
MAGLDPAIQGETHHRSPNGLWMAAIDAEHRSAMTGGHGVRGKPIQSEMVTR